MTKEPGLKTDRLRVVAESPDILYPGDGCVRRLKVYNSKSERIALVLRCPFCGMDMTSPTSARVKAARFRIGFLNRLLESVGVPAGPTVEGGVMCPFNAEHAFSITNGRIKQIQK